MNAKGIVERIVASVDGFTLILQTDRKPVHIQCSGSPATLFALRGQYVTVAEDLLFMNNDELVGVYSHHEACFNLLTVFRLPWLLLDLEKRTKTTKTRPRKRK